MGTKRFDLVRMIYKPAVFLLCLGPLAFLIFNYLTDNLSANPLSDITNETGVWTLRFLVVTLSITPLRKLTGWSPLQRFRRMVGLFAFLYVCLHFTTYLYLDKFFDWPEIVKDVAKRPFITVGFSAFLLLTPLAVTSFDTLMKWMGGTKWKRLHKLVYVCAGLGVVHYYWLVKADVRRPLMYGGMVGILLGYRLIVFLLRRFGAKRPVTKEPQTLPNPEPF